jgi:hypothetical protein
MLPKHERVGDLTAGEDAGCEALAWRLVLAMFRGKFAPDDSIPDNAIVIWGWADACYEIRNPVELDAVLEVLATTIARDLFKESHENAARELESRIAEASDRAQDDPR